MLELLVLSTLGTEPAQPVLAKPEGGRWVTSLCFRSEAVSAAVAGIFIKGVPPNSRPDSSLHVTQMWLWLHRQMVFKTFCDCRMPLGCPWKLASL